MVRLVLHLGIDLAFDFTGQRHASSIENEEGMSAVFAAALHGHCPPLRSGLITPLCVRMMRAMAEALGLTAQSAAAISIGSAMPRSRNHFGSVRAVLPSTSTPLMWWL